MDRLRNWLPAWLHWHAVPDSVVEDARSDEQRLPNESHQPAPETQHPVRDLNTVPISLSPPKEPNASLPPQRPSRSKRPIETAAEFVDVLSQAVEKEISRRDLQEKVSRLRTGVENAQFDLETLQSKADALGERDLPELDEYRETLFADIHKAESALEKAQCESKTTEKMLQSAALARDRLLERINAVIPRFVDQSMLTNSIAAFAVTPDLSSFLVMHARRHARLLQSQSRYRQLQRSFADIGRRVASIKAHLAARSTVQSELNDSAENSTDLQLELQRQKDSLRQANHELTLAREALELKRNLQHSRDAELLYDRIYPALREQGLLRAAASPSDASSQHSVVSRLPTVRGLDDNAPVREVPAEHRLLVELRQARKALARKRRQRNTFLETLASYLARFTWTYRNGTMSDFENFMETTMGRPVDQTNATLQASLEELVETYDRLKKQVEEAGVELPPLSPASLADHSSDGSNSTTYRWKEKDEDARRRQRKVRKWYRHVVRQKPVGSWDRDALGQGLDSDGMLKPLSPGFFVARTLSLSSTETNGAHKKAWLQRYIKHQERLRSQPKA